MRKFSGFLIIIGCFPLLFFLSSEISYEIEAARTFENQMQDSIEFPDITSKLPITLVDKNNDVYSEEYVEWRQPTSLENIPQIVKDIFIYSEDSDFYEHIGFDLSAIARALVINTAEQSVQQGGSTITQQLVRMRYLSEEKTYERKLMEIFYSYELEKHYSKTEILTMYLNEIYFSNQVYGISSAATYYFGKPLSKLSLAEIAFIAAIPNNPSLYDPLKNFEQTKARQERLLQILAEHEVITLAEAETQKSVPIQLNVKQKIQQYPAYSTYVLQELKWLVAQNEGFDVLLANAETEQDKEQLQKQLQNKVDALFQQGAIVHTALDPAKQLHDEQAINQILASSELQASATIINNETREITSIYGGKNYKKFDLHRAYQTPRQPGSAFKPLAVYAPYFETIDASPSSTVSGGAYCIGTFCPENYGGGLYGQVSLSTAFRHSYNTSALRLYNTIGIDTAFSYLERFNFRSLDPRDYTYATALGGLTYGVTSLELADAYTSFIDGSYAQAHAIRKVTDLQGNILYKWPTERAVIWSPKTVRYMRQLLTDVVTGGTGVGLYTSTNYLGAKTGTTNDFKDLWLAGLTATETAAVWLGYDIPQSMEDIERYQIHYQIFNAIMN
ncbi:transglycosylase domain-containing protein [Metasolibacillus sp.]|uniref:transglycosylase domain-containing protein n=1 Tax=Metasolibacillus sp. TaxID=2703680 RepID=UPI0025E9DAC4|nr:transglycosylase domain-containing protein [Metasolibacillus sp.]MCT6925009.1 penicillin-binding protein [Metasolibacillus sp.]MCT6942034.1 penicillin-binding protein [Metasolibacillus sp.]